MIRSFLTPPHRRLVVWRPIVRPGYPACKNQHPARRGVSAGALTAMTWRPAASRTARASGASSATTHSCEGGGPSSCAPASGPVSPRLTCSAVTNTFWRWKVCDSGWWRARATGIEPEVTIAHGMPAYSVIESTAPGNAVIPLGGFSVASIARARNLSGTSAFRRICHKMPQRGDRLFAMNKAQHLNASKVKTIGPATPRAFNGRYESTNVPSRSNRKPLHRTRASSGINDLISILARAQVVLTRAGMPDIQHPLVFSHIIGVWALKPCVPASARGSVLLFTIKRTAEVTRFRRGVKPREGDATFVDGLRIFEVGPETCSAWYISIISMMVRRSSVSSPNFAIQLRASAGRSRVQ